MGEFCDLLYLHTPFGASDHNGIEWQRTYPPGSPDPDRERYPYPLHPAPGGLLVRGTTRGGDAAACLGHGDGRGRLVPSPPRPAAGSRWAWCA
ncbi:hypothetical protein GCM10010343_59950 [Streptomyces avidinii]|nr:hypothetical protein GCM10010343_59950 [Streptomyces avidinii]